MDALLDQAIDASRSLTVELSPPVLYESGLRPALGRLMDAEDENRLNFIKHTVVSI